MLRLPEHGRPAREGPLGETGLPLLRCQAPGKGPRWAERKQSEIRGSSLLEAKAEATTPSCRLAPPYPSGRPPPWSSVRHAAPPSRILLGLWTHFQLRVTRRGPALATHGQMGAWRRGRAPATTAPLPQTGLSTHKLLRPLPSQTRQGQREDLLSQSTGNSTSYTTSTIRWPTSTATVRAPRDKVPRSTGRNTCQAANLTPQVGDGAKVSSGEQ